MRRAAAAAAVETKVESPEADGKLPAATDRRLRSEDAASPEGSGQVSPGSSPQVEAVRRRRPRVLVLGGWSDGPTKALMESCPEIEFYRPDIPMPPVGVKWLLNPYICLLVVHIFVVVPWLSQQAVRSGTASASQAALMDLVSLALLAILVSRLVRFAVWDGVRIACGAARKLQPDVVLGFSWGAAVTCWLIADEGWNGPTVLLAPTLRILCWISRLRMPTVPPHAHVFHGEFDLFCPQSQRRALEAMGCIMHTCEKDGHALSSKPSVETISRCLMSLAGAAWSQSAAKRKQVTQQTGRFALLQQMF
eukprot:TRINITY_DN58258_c0_g1_i1.p1 TRINITY_DN58258_c0_g1~~TRINITY_DN58258_c0_g1_i1.p1  ORF type:complete len:307 (+),score=80.37 TRINITY_DN58258_c0_g1_i1:67-987(+)